MRLSLRQLSVFIEVAERGTMLRAATALHLTPPAVSMQIRDLERELGISLFERKKRQLSLSIAGKYFIRYARRVLAEIRETEIAVACFKSLERGLLTIGTMRNSGHFVPGMVARFQAQHPHIDVNIRAARHREQLLAMMDTAEVELSVMSRPPSAQTACSEMFAPNPLVFVCSPGHPILRHAPPIPVKELNGRPFILREQQSSTRRMLDSFFAKHRCTPLIKMEIASNETIKRVVMTGMGLGFLSVHAVDLELHDGLLKLVNVESTPLMDTWHIVHLHSRVLSPGAQAFRNFIIKQGGKELREQTTALLLSGLKKGRPRSRRH